MNGLTKDELSALYSICAREAQLSKAEVSRDDFFYKNFIDHWDKLADKLRILHEEA